MKPGELSQTAGPDALLDRAMTGKPFAALPAALASSREIVLADVAAPGRGFAGAALVRAAHSIAFERRVAFVCANLREQEEFFNALSLWTPDAVFFPQLEIAAVEGALPDPEISAERLSVLARLAADGPDAMRVVVLTRDSLSDPAPPPGVMASTLLEIRAGAELDPGALSERLDAAGYERAAQIAARGQYAIRGGIIDVFSWHHLQPLRIELFGETVDSLRVFDVDTQTSVLKLESAELAIRPPARDLACIADYFKESLLVDVDAGMDGARATITAAPALETHQAGSDGPMVLETAIYEVTAGRSNSGSAGDFVLTEASRESVVAQLRGWQRAGWLTAAFSANEGEEQRLREILGEDAGTLLHLRGSLQRGFIHDAARLAVLSDAELFGRFQTPRARRAGAARRFAAPADLSELAEGELVVHLEHGIGRFDGVLTQPDGAEALAIEYAGGARLYVPIEQAYLVSRYSGLGRARPQLSALGDGKWARAKAGAERSVRSYAAKLLEVQAERTTRHGHPFSPDKPWQREFEAAFPYKETPDQLRAIEAAKQDMESTRPMDRLICGDVGFGKTEVALRAAFKAVMDGKQVAMLCPTTVLAQQHHQTFSERLADYPVRVDVLSRFRTKKETANTLAALAEGTVDIVIGTHRLISPDVKFKNLGLVIVDEEQRFGVAHKERFKTLFRLVDQLTLSATPIPRTLYLSLMGARDMSTIETPPPNRYPVETVVCGYDERIVRDAIERELARKGQVYFLHNRVGTIERMAGRLKLLCPKARIAIGHGQMGEKELEDVMARFVAGESDVLVATTIIESGIDIPNANTIVIDRADRFGLADLYQLRGRVGRAQHKAYAYLMLPRDAMTAGAARKRIGAIKQYTELGAGFRVAMRDLEIRGAGNLLGAEQSGHVMAVGFDLYCQLLRQAIAQLRDEPAPPRGGLPVRIDFVVTKEGHPPPDPQAEPLDAFLPRSFVRETSLRLAAYRELASAPGDDAIDAVHNAWRDRFGPVPDAVEHLLTLARIERAADAARFTSVETKGERLMLRRGGDYVLIGGRFPRLTQSKPAARLAEVLNYIEAFRSGSDGGPSKGSH